MPNMDLKYDIDRCNARLAGIMPMGYMDKERMPRCDIGSITGG